MNMDNFFKDVGKDGLSMLGFISNKGDGNFTFESRAKKVNSKKMLEILEDLEGRIKEIEIGKKQKVEISASLKLEVLIKEEG